jgi:uncharacterized membrane protein
MKQDKGTAGLTILLSVVVMLFVIGLMIMIFSLMGNGMKNAIYTATTSTSTNESLARPTTAGITLTVGDSATNGECGTITAILNGTTGGGQPITSGNWTQTGCTVVNATNWVTLLYSTNVRYTYPYTYDADNEATRVIGNTTEGIGGAVDWFDIFIVITAMVVLILLTVIIITAIRSSGLVQAGGTQGANKVGTA